MVEECVYGRTGIKVLNRHVLLYPAFLLPLGYVQLLHLCSYTICATGSNSIDFEESSFWPRSIDDLLNAPALQLIEIKYVALNFVGVMYHFQLDKTTESVGESEVKPTDGTSQYETVRTIDARLLSFKHISLALLVLLASTAAAYYFQKQKSPFY
ncbi:hypothetical protein Gotur_012481 [Gossypium turneri]